MSITYVFAMLGGLALFLYGMDLMSTSLEVAAGNKMNRIIEKLTSSPIKGVLVGAVVTAIIQSSSATTVMVVGFVNAGLMTIYQSVGVIMGANIGTTITGQLVALNITKAAPLIAFVGFLMFKGFKNDKMKYIGQCIMGLGILFMGMEFMSDAMKPLKEEPAFVSLMTRFKNPVLGVLAGTIFTATIQSSSSSLGILQAIANQGLINLSSSMYIICGFNIGTCITSVLSSLSSNKNAKRTSTVHVLFNLIGTIIFIIISLFVPIDEFVIRFSKDLPAAQIANMHTLFNVMTTIILFPFCNKLADLASKIIRGQDEDLDQMEVQFINERTVNDPAVAFTNTRAEVTRMLGFAKENFNLALDLFYKYDNKKYEKLFRNERIINFLNTRITKYAIDVLGNPMDDALAENFTGYMRITRDIERIGDHVKNIAESSKLSSERELSYSDISIEELEKIKNKIESMFDIIESNIEKTERTSKLKAMHLDVEDLVFEYRNEHMERMKEKLCDPESGLIYEKMLIALERVSSYLSNTGKLSV